MLKHTHKILILFICINTVLILTKQSLYAQNAVIENIIEDIASNSELENIDYSTFAEDLSFYLENPLNLNEANTENLEKLHFLTETQIYNLLNYITLKDGMATIYELQLIDGFNQIVIDKMLPFVRVIPKREEKSLELDKIYKYGKHKLITETGFALETSRAYKFIENKTDKTKISSHYEGDKMMYKLRYKFHYKDRIFLGITAEKDPGETFNFTHEPYGFDFYSAHFQINELGVIKQINVGDFHARFGQGLIMWTGFGFGKSSDLMSIRKRGKTLRYYSSTNEDNFLRGLGATVKLGIFKITSFLSYKKTDATIDNSDTIENSIDKFVSLKNSGYHRTKTELKNRKVLGELIAGSKFSMNINNLKLALNFVGYKYDKAIEPSQKPYKLYDLKDDYNLNASFDYLYYYKKISFFGELAIDKDIDFATINGFTASVVSQLSFSLLHRYYQKDYNAQYACAFGENSKVSNEQGMYYGIEFYPFSKVRFSAYVDLFRFSWLKYRVDAPSNGYEYLLNFKYAINRNVNIELKYKTEQKAINVNQDSKAINLIKDKKTDYYRLHISYKFSDFISFANRIEVSAFEQSEAKQYGYLFYQDAHFKLSKLPMFFFLRYTVFDASYDNRIYSYENDLLYNFYVPSFSGKGSSFYIMYKYDLSSLLSIRLKYRQTFYPTKKTIGTGLSSINGNIKSYLKLQLVFNI